MLRQNSTLKLVALLGLAFSALALSACNLFSTKSSPSSNSSTTPVNVSLSSISSGSYHSCILTQAGGVQCWGFNLFGQLGNGGTTNSSSAVSVTGLSSGVSQLAVGGYSSCAIVNAAVQCWGYNGFGQLGNNTTTNSSIPVAAVNQLTAGVTQISVGYDHACAIVNGLGYCWGSNGFGQLGNNSTTNSSIPVQVLNNGLTALTGIQAISAGYQSTCAIANGAVFCWGQNGSGQLGIGSTNGTANVVPPAAPIIASGAQAISVGNQFACAIVNGAVKCWGDNTNGEVGINSVVTPQTSPVAATVLTGGVTSISLNGSFTGGQHACAVMNGATYCWGYNSNGQDGNGTTTNVLQATAVAGVASGILNISVGGYHSCALAGTSMSCWGMGTNGQLGTGGSTDQYTPQTLTGYTSAVMQVVQGMDHSCALVSGGVKCWGSNSNGQLGNGLLTNSSSSVSVTGLGAGSGVQMIAAGANFTCALVNGGVQCWGTNALGQLGNNNAPTASLVPVTVVSTTGALTLTNVQAIFAGTGNHVCAIVGGAVDCWGDNTNGQIGAGATGGTNPFPTVSVASGAQQVSVGLQHTCGVVNGAALCWGLNASNQLGDNTVITRNVPTSPTGGVAVTAGVQSIAAGGSHSCAIVGGASVCWGVNAAGQIGDSTNTLRPTPTASSAPLTSGVSAISVGTNHSCAIVNGAAKCWGDNTHGELGNNNLPTNSNVAVAVAAITTNAFSINAGDSSTCGLNNGSVSCWGQGSFGELGNGLTADQQGAVNVTGP